MIQRATDWAIAAVITSIYWTLSRTWRVERRGTTAHDNCPSPRIYAHWHGDELLLIGAHAYRDMAVLSSQSRDGGRMARLLSWLGYRVIRGSSTRGGVGGLKGLVGLVLKKSCDASLAVDGPHGPIGEVKMGVLKLAQLTRAPLIPGVAAARRRYIFERAWNKCYLPLPLSRCVVLYGDPITIPRLASDEELEKLRLQLQGALTDLKAKAEHEVERVFVTFHGSGIS